MRIWDGVAFIALVIGKIYFYHMPRKKRIALIGEIHHVMSRGLDGDKIFRDDTDRKKLLSIIANAFLDAGCKCYAWVLMDNHYHLVIRPTHQSLQRIMQRINGSYARSFNIRHHRRGYLFQDRYKSLATQDYWYLRELIRYVHLNPLRAGIVQSLDDLSGYYWSGHRQILGLGNLPWYSENEVLGKFGKMRSEARKSYLKWLSEGINADEGWGPKATEQEKGVNDPRITGEASFVKKATEEFHKEQVIRNRAKQNRPELVELFKTVCSEYDMSVDMALTRGRRDKRSEAKVIFCKRAAFLMGYSLREISTFLGVNASSVARMVWKK